MNQALDEVLQIIRKEFDTASDATRAGNQGMARVCARRAAGAAIAFWMNSHPRSGWGMDTMNRLRALQYDDTMPFNVREAVARLTSRVPPRSAPTDLSPPTSSPLDDSRTIIIYLLGVKEV